MIESPFAGQPTEFSDLYRNAPEESDPSEDLFTKLQESIKSDQLGAIAQGGEAPKTSATTLAKSTNAASANSAATLARVKPLGITGAAQLRGKSDAELRKLSTDAVAYELRQASLSRFFGKNPDGSWNYEMGPDGRPTGLDAAGHVIPPQAAAPAASAAQPAPARTAAPKPAAAPAAPTVAAPPSPAAPKVVSQARTSKRATTVASAPVVKQPVDVNRYVTQTGTRATRV